jgi:GNAT superfamily N-acetyltransferase
LSRRSCATSIERSSDAGSRSRIAESWVPYSWSGMATTPRKLRLLYVEPSARGLGTGRRLADECVRFAKSAGSHKLIWTDGVLVDARRTAASARNLVGPTWERTLVQYADLTRVESIECANGFDALCNSRQAPPRSMTMAYISACFIARLAETPN